MSKILDADVRVQSAGTRYRIRVEATDRAAALLFALGIEYQNISPSQDSGRAWCEFEYSRALNETLKDLIDAFGDLIFRQPGFGQLELFEVARDG